MNSVKVIINPASGKDIPVLSILNDVFRGEVRWDVSVTLAEGDAHRFAEQAARDGFDIVAVYGGDGTVSEVAHALRGTQMPLALLPGGTGNGVARFMNIPIDLHESAKLVKGEFATRPMDLGQVNGRSFILRADMGFIAATDEGTSRAAKDHFGKWAYALSGFKLRSQLEPLPYQLVIDGTEVEVEAVTILVVNVGAVAFGQRPIVHDCRPDDGLLDLLVLTQTDIVALAEVASSALFGNRTPMQRWQIRKVTVQTPSPQAVALDGEMVESTPAQIEVIPGAVNLVVPMAPGGSPS